MTTPTIDEQIEATAKKFVRESNDCELLDDYSAHENTYKHGASFGRELERKRILEMLRSEEAEIENGIICEEYLSNREWADWLEKELQDKV